MLENIKKPIVIAACSAASLIIIGAAIGWFGIENELARSFTEDELSGKELAAMVVGVVSIGFTLLAAALNKKMIAIVAVLVCLYGTLLVNNQMPDSDTADLLGISITIGYWLSLGSSFIAAVANGMIAIKGFDAPLVGMGSLKSEK